MIELQYITNERTKERRLYYRFLKFRIDASGAINVLPAPVEYGEWILVPELTINESAMQDLIESGGIQGAP